ncbi:MAG: glycoside hydrolase family 2 TIM barrel-domain containing protein [Bacteroidota bacterium]
MPRHFTLDRQKSRNTFSLNGSWNIAGGNTVSFPDRFDSIITVPSVVDTAVPPYDWQSFDFHWYRTSFTIDRLSHSDFLILKIEQSMFGTGVWLNGHYLGGSISCYTSHEYALDEFLNREGVNELTVRVGAKRTLPPESAIGRDQEKEIYTPGIWGDVSLICVGGARVKLVQVIPHIYTGVAEVRAWIQNLEFKRESVLVSARIFERHSEVAVSPIEDAIIQIDDHGVEQVTFDIPIDKVKLWSPEQPFLYEVELTVQEGRNELDSLRTTFGMREFTVSGPDFYLNGQKILLRGGNIAFHRFLADSQRAFLPWDALWIKRALIDVPKEHNFNFFRNHLGQMYNKWYDVADEHGMLIQNEWQFWCTTGSNSQIRTELTEWLHDNWNHPSIIIWDPLNESTDDTVQFEIVPEMKKLDPTRPWESVDFREEHPYIYSLGEVMNNRTFGFSRSLHEIEHLPVPSMVNEFLWWWFNDKWEPTVLTTMIVERWMGREYAKENVIAHQSFLAQELIELFRRMRIKAIQPFVYISNNDGPTAHWFLGNIKDLQPKPLLKAIKNAFAPFGISIDLWDRHFFVNEQRSIRICVFNDSNVHRNGIVKVGIRSMGGAWVSKSERNVDVPPMDDVSFTMDVTMPNTPGEWKVFAELIEYENISAFSEKSAITFREVEFPKFDNPVTVYDPSEEITAFLVDHGIPVIQFSGGKLDQTGVMMLHGNIIGERIYEQSKDEVTRFVQSGGTVILIEPEYRIVGTAATKVVADIELRITHRADPDKGGYDTYVFAEDHSHPVWKNIDKEHLKFFNGAYGGEIVSQYDVDFSVPSKRLASCGIGLKVTAASEVEFGNGKIILSRLQLRGRLKKGAESDSMYARRPDPVAQQLLLNLLEYANRSSETIISMEKATA